MGCTQGKNKHSTDSIFLLQFLNVQYMADNCAKFEKKGITLSFAKCLKTNQKSPC